LRPEVMEAIDSLTTWLQLIVLVASVVTLAVTVAKTAQKPNKTQDERLDALEAWKVEVENRLETGSRHFESIDQGNRVTQEALLALMSHAINGNDVEKLKEAKAKLESYLIEK
jgi:hypothetical protein